MAAASARIGPARKCAILAPTPRHGPRRATARRSRENRFMSMRVSIASVASVLAVSAVPVASAHDFPTVDRVQYVLECMYRNGGSSVYVYKCSCVIDTIAQKYTYEQWTDAS